ncbi:PD-(D/E)XK nuclease family protein [Bacteroidales bacterium OttesenSCG-928-A17]|nr:PD-(D/E)XK nuclease family protein [Bacteroidales bacterium OttesenSCG-928-A17]
MNIIFSPFYDGEKYIDYSKTPIIDKMFVGPLGLLSELELRAGLTCRQLPEIERQAMYLLALKKYIAANPESIFAQSFSVDDFGVATELLNWRDNLVKAGWDKKSTGISEKLDTLAAIEDHFSCMGESDRWAQIVARTETENILPSGWEIEVRIPKELLQPILSTIFDNLERQGAKVSYVETLSCATPGTNLQKIQAGLANQEYEMDITSPDDSIRIIKFRRLCDAYEWAAQQDYNSGNTVIVNENRKVFNNILFSYGKARTGSVIRNSNPQIVQLFKLGLSLFIKPLNVYNLLSYLQIQVNPLPSDLRYQLTNIIINTGGLGQKWDEAITNYEFKDADGNVNEAKKEKRLIFIEMLSAAKGECIEVLDLKKYISAMNAWAIGRLSVYSLADAGIREQLSDLSTFCEAFLILVNNTSDETISFGQLKSWMLSIYRPSNYTHEDAQESSTIAIESPVAVVDSPKKLLWLDCFGQNTENFPFDFLNNTEVQYLCKKGVRLWDKDLENRSMLWSVKDSLRKVSGSLDIVMSAENNGKTLPIHPVIIELQERLKDKFNLLIVDEADLSKRTEQGIVTPLPEPKVEYRFDNLNVQAREKESYSSLEKLILWPFDYTLEYFARLKNKSVRQIQDLERTKGNVAHKMIEELVEDSGSDIAKFRELWHSEFDDRFRCVVEEVGLILLLDENRIEQEKFRFRMRNSLEALSNIMLNNDLRLIGCEVSETAVFDGMPGIETYMDLLLTNNVGEYVIFDMKWSSSNYYRNKLAKNKAMQLEIYRAVMEKKHPDKKVAAVGYFMLPKGLLVISGIFKNTAHIMNITPDNTADVFSQVRNSYTYRYNQLCEGVVEEAEAMAFNEIAYCNDTSDHGLYPLDSEYGTEDIKVVNKFSSFGTLKGHLK